MFTSYDDVTSKIPEKPQWWDEHGVPRYIVFTPRHAANIYADEVALLSIACFGCLTEYRVSITNRDFPVEVRGNLPVAGAIRDGSIDYCDPPNSGCCGVGPSTGCYNLRVLEYWSRQVPHREWTRDATLEIELPENAEYRNQFAP
jgi:hypothetical protein